MVASAVQWIATLAAVGVVWWAFRGRMRATQQAAVLLAAALLAAPHSGAYDLLLPTAAAALLVARGATSWMWLLALLVWLAPLLGLPLLSAPARFTPFLTLAVLACALRPARPVP